MKKTKQRHANLYLALAALTLALLLNRLYLRYRPLPLTSPMIDPLSATVVTEAMATVPPQVVYPHLIITKLGVTLPIYPARVVDGKWQTTTAGLSHAQGSADFGVGGNTVVYGHNWPNMLRRLPELVPGDTIEVWLSAQEKLTFVTTYTAVIAPSDTSLTTTTPDTRLTLYTCTGWFDQDRFVVVAHPR